MRLPSLLSRQGARASAAKHSIQRMEASHLGQFQFLHLGRLAPTADARRWENGRI